VLFPTLDYLVFLPLTVLLFWAVPRRFRLWVIGLASTVFYASWRLSYLPVLVGMALVTWLFGLWFARRDREPTRVEKAAAMTALFLPLLLCKYWDWIASDLDAVASTLGLGFSIPLLKLGLPVGISFFTFQAAAYVIDTWRDKEAERDPVRFWAFKSFFPQLVAGPIVRRAELLPALRELRLLRRDDVGVGLYKIARGMAKKVLFADVVRVGIVDPMFLDPGRFTGPELLVGLYAYTLQMYCDFSGYTDVAIGSARLFGIDLPENFRRPYLATSVAGFWRRWHLTLSNWVRDYVYFPLGGAKGSSARVTFNILLTMLVIGVWHGASWNFVIYGLLHGSAVAFNRMQRKWTGRRPDDPLPNAWAWLWRFLLTFHFVVLARILFRAPDLPSAWSYTLGLFRWDWLMPRFSYTAWAMFLVGYAAHFSPERWREPTERAFIRLGPAGWAVGLVVLVVLCQVLGTGESLAFIYYQF
jgi:alginate O-acetyltransferase complex protein AlgI